MSEAEIVEGEVVEDAMVLHQAGPPPTLFGTNDPLLIVSKATDTADALADVINRKRLFTQIGDKKHISVEGWTLLGTMLGVFPVIEWTRKLDNGWEARVQAVTLGGEVIGAAEAMCTRDEPPGRNGKENRWKSAPEYSIRSMAQTRAISKALRVPLGFVVTLAGYSATPSEEVDGNWGGRSRRKKSVEDEAYGEGVDSSADDTPRGKPPHKFVQDKKKAEGWCTCGEPHDWAGHRD